MAIPVLAPTIERSKKLNPTRSNSRTFLNLVPDIKAGETVDRKFFVIFLSIVSGVGLIALLTINTLLAQDAFELRKLQNQVINLNDQRDALLKQISTASSPEVLARRATAAGMVASQSPRFLSLPPLAQNTKPNSPSNEAAR